ncbi:MAG: VWA domain-containing protein [Myxococcaceae bacterium]|nr:VWA domain-containing protein [Myxococcaceae bacterium]
MNRTTVYLVSACALGLVALVMGVPGTKAPTPAPPPAPLPVPAPAPVVVVQPPPIEQVAPVPVASSKPGSLSLTGKLSHPYVVPGSSDVFATLEVSAVDVPGARRAPVNMALVIDRSGSMSGAKLQNAKRAAKELLDRLDARDSLAIVHYGSDVKGLPSRKVTEENREVIRRYIANLYDDGGTNIGAGLVTGEQFIERGRLECEGCIDRLVLMSDGQPTEGMQSVKGLTNLSARMHGRGISVTSLGIGYDFNEDLMTQIAMVGGGSYGYLKDAAVLASIIQRDLQQAGTLVARDVKLSARVPAGVTVRDVLGRPFTQSGSVVTITLPDFSARQVEKLVVQLAASAPANDGAAFDVADFSLDYQDVLKGNAADSKLKLAAMVTTDRTLADARRDRDAVVVATRARASVNYKKMADAVSNGRYEEARKAVEANDRLFFEAESVAGAAAVAADKNDNQQAFGLIQAAPSAPARQMDAVKSMKVQSQRSAGAGDSLY